MEYPDEVWKTYPHNTTYQFSNLGRIRREDNKRIISAQYKFNKDTRQLKYSVVEMYSDRYDNTRGRRKVNVHRAVAELFLPEPPSPDRAIVNHRDGNKTNNQASNLEWVTPKENAQHAVFMGLNACLGAPQLTRDNVMSILQEYVEFKEGLATKYNIEVNA